MKGESAKVKEEVVEIALADERVKKWVPSAHSVDSGQAISGQDFIKVVFVPGKLLSLVV